MHSTVKKIRLHFITYDLVGTIINGNCNRKFKKAQRPDLWKSNFLSVTATQSPLLRCGRRPRPVNAKPSTLHTFSIGTAVEESHLVFSGLIFESTPWSLMYESE